MNDDDHDMVSDTYINIHPVGYLNDISVFRLFIHDFQSTTVKQCMQDIKKSNEIAENVQQFYFDGSDLREHRTLGYYGIKNGDTVYLKNLANVVGSRIELKSILSQSSGKPEVQKRTVEEQMDDMMKEEQEEEPQSAAPQRTFSAKFALESIVDDANEALTVGQVVDATRSKKQQQQQQSAQKKKKKKKKSVPKKKAKSSMNKQRSLAENQAAIISKLAELNGGMKAKRISNVDSSEVIDRPSLSVVCLENGGALPSARGVLSRLSARGKRVEHNNNHNSSSSTIGAPIVPVESPVEPIRGESQIQLTTMISPSSDGDDTDELPPPPPSHQQRQQQRFENNDDDNNVDTNVKDVKVDIKRDSGEEAQQEKHSKESKRKLLHHRVNALLLTSLVVCVACIVVAIVLKPEKSRDNRTSPPSCSLWCDVNSDSFSLWSHSPTENVYVGAEFTVQQPRTIWSVSTLGDNVVSVSIYEDSKLVSKYVGSISSHTSNGVVWYTMFVYAELVPDSVYVVVLEFPPSAKIFVTSETSKPVFPIVARDFGVYSYAVDFFDGTQQTLNGQSSFLIDLALAPYPQTSDTERVVKQSPPPQYGNGVPNEPVIVYYDRPLSTIPSPVIVPSVNGGDTTWTYDDVRWALVLSNALEADTNYTVSVSGYTWWFVTGSGFWRNGDDSLAGVRNGQWQAEYRDYEVVFTCTQSGLLSRLWYPQEWRFAITSISIWDSHISHMPRLRLSSYHFNHLWNFAGTWQPIVLKPPTSPYFFMMANRQYTVVIRTKLGPPQTVAPPSSNPWRGLRIDSYSLLMDVSFQAQATDTYGPIIIGSYPVMSDVVSPFVTPTIYLDRAIDTTIFNATNDVFFNVARKPVNCTVIVVTKPHAVIMLPRERLLIGSKGYEFGLNMSVRDTNGYSVQLAGAGAGVYIPKNRTIGVVYFSVQDQYTWPMSLVGSWRDFPSALTFKALSSVEFGVVLRTQRRVPVMITSVGVWCGRNAVHSEYKAVIYDQQGSIVQHTDRVRATVAGWTYCYMPTRMVLTFNQTYTVMIHSFHGHYSSGVGDGVLQQYPWRNGSMVFLRSVWNVSSIVSPPNDLGVDIRWTENEYASLVPPRYTLNLSSSGNLTVSNFSRLYSIAHWVPPRFMGTHRILVHDNSRHIKALTVFVRTYAANTSRFGRWQHIDLAHPFMLSASVNYSFALTTTSNASSVSVVVPQEETTTTSPFKVVLGDSVASDKSFVVYQERMIDFSAVRTRGGVGAIVRLKCIMPGRLTHARMWKFKGFKGPFRVSVLERLKHIEIQLPVVTDMDMGEVDEHRSYFLEKKFPSPVAMVPGRYYDVIYWSDEGHSLYLQSIPEYWPLTRGPVQVVEGLITYVEYFEGEYCGENPPCHYGADARWEFMDEKKPLPPTPAPTPPSTKPTTAPSVSPSAFPTRTPTQSPTPAPTPSNYVEHLIPHPIYGVHVSGFYAMNYAKAALPTVPHKPTVRVIMSRSYNYIDDTKHAHMKWFHNVSYTLCTFVDVLDMALLSVQEFKAHAQSMLDFYGDVCDIWELGYAVNMAMNTIDFDPRDVGRKLTAAHEMVKARNMLSAITFDYNSDLVAKVCYSVYMAEWAVWLKTYLPEHVRLETNYAFLAMTRDGIPDPANDCVPSNWTVVFDVVKEWFPNSYVGFGMLNGFGKSASQKLTTINTYYRMVANQHVGTRDFVGGFFYASYLDDLWFSTETQQTSVLISEIVGASPPPTLAGVKFVPHRSYSREYGVVMPKVSIVICGSSYSGSVDSSGVVSGVSSAAHDAIKIGDTADNFGVRGFFSCNLADVLHANPTVHRVKLALAYNSTAFNHGNSTQHHPLVGNALGDLLLDVKFGHFGGNAALESDDYHDVASISDISLERAGYMSPRWTPHDMFTANVNLSHAHNVQFRLKFKTRTDFDGIEDFVNFYSGGDVAHQVSGVWHLIPKLIITHGNSSTSFNVSVPSWHDLSLPDPSYPGATRSPPMHTPSGFALTPFKWVELTSGEIACQSTRKNAIAKENCRTGATRFEWDVLRAGDNFIVGFTSEFTMNVGSIVYFKINTSATTYTIDIYRMGYYNGTGARLVASTIIDHSVPQPDCMVNVTEGNWAWDQDARMYDCRNWHVSAAWDSDSSISGVYFARIYRHLNTSTRGSHVFFVLRNDSSHSDMIVQTSDTTWQAYNSFGGASIYTLPRGYWLSYQRPFVTRATYIQNTLFYAEYPMIRFLEEQGYDVTYMSGVDTEVRPHIIHQHRLWMSSGHDEYWSREQRESIVAARKAGVSLAWFSANTMFWKTAWMKDDDGPRFRCMRDTTQGYAVDLGAWTGTWRDAGKYPSFDGEPENAVLGQLFEVNGDNAYIEVPSEYGHYRLWRHTNISVVSTTTQNGTQNATRLGYRTLGYEWDEDADNGHRPPGTIRLSYTHRQVPLKAINFGNSYAPGVATHTLTMHKDPISGALVFGSGTVQWAWGLGTVATDEVVFTKVDRNVRQATVNFFADVGISAETLAHDIVEALPSTDTTPPSVTFDNTTLTNVIGGSTITVSGNSSDIHGRVGGVEFSSNNAIHYRRADLHLSHTQPYVWSYVWHVPNVERVVSVVLAVRATDDSLNTSEWVKRMVVITPTTP